MRLQGKLALITGGASGIGKAGAELFARQGAAVAVADRDGNKLEAVVDAITRAGGRAAAIEADLSDPTEARRVVHEAAARLGGLDILWCNAGMTGPGAIEDLQEQDYGPTLALNQVSVMISCGEALAPMRARDGGAIVITSSTSGLVGAMGSPTYSASKFAVVGWAKSLAQRVAPDRIRVNAICPGPTATPLMLGAMAEGSGHLSGEEYSRRILGGIPLNRLGEPTEIAHAALWLASDDASYVTGIALPVDGGYTCR